MWPPGTPRAPRPLGGAIPPGAMAPTEAVDPLPAGIVPMPDLSPPTGIDVSSRGRRSGLRGLMGRLVDTRGKKILLSVGLGLLVLLVGLGLLGRYRASRRPRPAPKPQPQNLEAIYARGKALMKARKWAEARQVFEQLAAQDPTNSFVRTRLKEIEQNEEAARTLARAKDKLRQGDVLGAGVLAELVPKESVYYEEAQQLVRKAKVERVSKLLAEARALKDKGLEDLAREKVASALKILPDHRPALELRHELGGPPPEEASAPREASGTEPAEESERGEGEGAPLARQGTARPVAPAPRGRPRARPRPRGGVGRPFRRAGGSRGQFLAFYKARNWSAAAAELRRLAAAQRGARARRTKALEAKVRAMAAAFQKAERQKASNSLAAMSAYQKALRLDRAISGGVHGAYIKRQLAKVARAAAGSAFSAGRYAQAYRAAQVARKYGGNSAAVARIMAQLERKAKEIFFKGYVLRDKNLAKAKSYWRLVLRMVPSSSQWYKKANTYLRTYGRPRPASDSTDEL